MTIPYFNMTSKVTAGKVVFSHVHSIAIEESITQLGNKATVTLPRFYRTLEGESVLDYLKVGDKVSIEMGYNGELKQEFIGYVASIDSEIPLRLMCEDEYYILKQNTLANKSYKAATLKEVLTYAAPGYTIDCPAVPLGKFTIDNHASTYNVIHDLQQRYSLFTRIDGKKLTVGFSYEWQPGKTVQHKLHRRKNVRSSDLTWKHPEDFKLRIKVEYKGAKGKKAFTYVGDEGGGTQPLVTTATSEAAAKELGWSRLRKTLYDGYTGTVTSFGNLPQVHAGDSIEFQDDQTPGRESGVYLVDKVSIDYGPGGYSRTSSLAHKID